MPVSNELRYVLKKLSIRRLGDLSSITEKDLRAVFKNTAQLIAEIDGLIDLVRPAHSDPVPTPFSPVIKLATLPANTHESALLHHAPPVLETQPPPPEYIFIPTAERGRSVKAFVLSVRLCNVLEAGNIRLTGELHGKRYAEIAKYRNCGRKTLVELRELVRQLQSGSDEVASYDQQMTPVNTSMLVVPPSARVLKLTELPLSARLENVLQQCGYRSLGDLNGREVGDLLSLKSCGRKSILELRELIYRAGMGEFSAIAAGDIASRLRQVASAIDAGFARVSGRDRKIYKARLIGNNGSPRTLEDVGLEFKMTRERVRQIVKIVMLKIRRGGGPKFEEGYEDRKMPLSAALAESGLDKLDLPDEIKRRLASDDPGFTVIVGEKPEKMKGTANLKTLIDKLIFHPQARRLIVRKPVFAVFNDEKNLSRLTAPKLNPKKGFESPTIIEVPAGAK